MLFKIKILSLWKNNIFEVKLDLVIFSDNKIPEISKPVEKFDNDLLKIVKAMFDAIHKYNGIGLASVQIGVPKRIVIAEINGEKVVAVNPEIIFLSKEMDEMEESNLSLSNIKVNVSRPTKIKIKYQNLSGKFKELEAEGLMARCLQHEIEQLDGKNILDHIRN